MREIKVRGVRQEAQGLDPLGVPAMPQGNPFAYDEPVEDHFLMWSAPKNTYRCVLRFGAQANIHNGDFELRGGDDTYRHCRPHRRRVWNQMLKTKEANGKSKACLQNYF